jgi:valyl-tRNA synthetase
MHMDKAYDAKSVEDEIYAAWEKSGYFTPENLPNFEDRKESFAIILPPPNVTGTLHMGHAVMLAIEDALTRYARMQGKKALWLPGTDHAAIATQTKVEKILLKEEGKTRHDVGREDFLNRVRDFAQQSHDTIVNQMKKMGASVDWSREAYTLDDQRNLAVRTAFKRMYDDGLIYRGYRVVNWDPVGQTTISDDELVYKSGKASFYTFKYSKDFPIAISTTRPETKVGDTAVAVHPDDARYKEYIGQEFDVDFAGAKLKIKVVADEEVDASFGTGALGVTPAHSIVDAGIAKRHNLPMKQVIGEDGKMMSEAGELVAGKTTLEARDMIASWLREEGLLQGEEEIEQNLSTAERSGGIIEPLPKMQWFIDVNKEFAFKQSQDNPIPGLQNGQVVTLKKLMQHVVRDEVIDILPDRFNKTYFHWIDNLRDWNISRQIWFGHQVPVWYRGNEMHVGVEAPEGDGWTQDEDTLDTWFSSGLWTFSTLGWPDEQAADLKTYHPTTVLETGYDILFFWVARMILMTTYHLGEIPFETVYLHGLVRDEKGRKMSKSLDNIINPLDMIDQYGADATRLSLLIGSTPGNDQKLSIDKVASFRNFTNKLWNIARFVLSSVDNIEVIEDVEPQTAADHWILERFTQVEKEVTQHFEKYELSILGEKLRAFTWGDFADWYLEVAKVQKSENTDKMLLFILERLLRLWHPFMPFVTEEIYKQFDAGMMIVAPWPKIDVKYSAKQSELFESTKEVIGALRNLRANYRIAPKTLMNATIVSGKQLEAMSSLIISFARLETLDFQESMQKPEGCASLVVGRMQIYVPLAGLIDVEKEQARIKKQLNETQRYVDSIEKKLANPGFVNSAPDSVVEGERERLAQAKEKLTALKDEFEGLIQ